MKRFGCLAGLTLAGLITMAQTNGTGETVTSRNASKTEPAKLLAVFVVDTNDKALTTLVK